MLCSKQTRKMQLMTVCAEFVFCDFLGIRHKGGERIQFPRAAFGCHSHDHGGSPSHYLMLFWTIWCLYCWDRDTGSRRFLLGVTLTYCMCVVSPCSYTEWGWIVDKNPKYMSLLLGSSQCLQTAASANFCAAEVDAPKGLSMLLIDSCLFVTPLWQFWHTGVGAPEGREKLQFYLKIRGLPNCSVAWADNGDGGGTM